MIFKSSQKPINDRKKMQINRAKKVCMFLTYGIRGKDPIKNKIAKTIPTEFGKGFLWKSLFFGFPKILNVSMSRL